MSLSFPSPPTTIENLHSSPQVPYLNTTPSLSSEGLDSCSHRLYRDCWASLVTQTGKNICLQMQETWIRSLGWEDPLQKGMAAHSSILAWEISWTKEAGGLQSLASQRVGHDWGINTYTTHTHIETSGRASLISTFLSTPLKEGDIC